MKKLIALLVVIAMFATMGMIASALDADDDSGDVTISGEIASAWSVVIPASIDVDLSLATEQVITDAIELGVGTRLEAGDVINVTALTSDDLVTGSLVCGTDEIDYEITDGFDVDLDADNDAFDLGITVDNSDYNTLPAGEYEDVITFTVALDEA